VRRLLGQCPLWVPSAILVAAHQHRTGRAAAVAREATDAAASDAGMPPRSWSLESVVAVAVMFGAHMIEQAKLLSRRDAMPIYISRGRFTSDAVKGMLAKPENREEAVAKLFESVGGRLTSTSGSTASTCRPGSKTRPSACWSSSAPHPRARRNSSASSTACARAHNLGRGSLSTTSRPSTGSTCARPTSSKARSPRCSLAVEIAILWSHTNEQTGAPAFGYPAKDQRELAAECRRL
jgi:hypothetical protein